MKCSMPGFPVHHRLPEFAQTHVHWIGDAYTWINYLKFYNILQAYFRILSTSDDFDVLLKSIYE